MSKKNWLFSIVLLLALILAACAPAASPQTQAPEATQPPAAEQPTEAMQPTEPPPAAQPSETPAQAEHKVATFIWTQEFDSLNPYYTNM